MLTVWTFGLQGPRHNGVVQPHRFTPCDSAVLWPIKWANAEVAAPMEDDLSVYARILDPKRPVVCRAEKP